MVLTTIDTVGVGEIDFTLAYQNVKHYKQSSRGLSMRAKTIPHVEYEVLNWILDNIEVQELEQDMVPTGDKIAKDRFDKGVASVAKLVNNMVQRRLHKIPEDHPDYEVAV